MKNNLFKSIIIDYMLVLIDLEHRADYHNIMTNFDKILVVLKDKGYESVEYMLYHYYYIALKERGLIPKEDLIYYIFYTRVIFEIRYAYIPKYTLYLSKHFFI